MGSWGKIPLGQALVDEAEALAARESFLNFTTADRLIASYLFTVKIM